MSTFSRLWASRRAPSSPLSPRTCCLATSCHPLETADQEASVKECKVARAPGTTSQPRRQPTSSVGLYYHHSSTRNTFSRPTCFRESCRQHYQLQPARTSQLVPLRVLLWHLASCRRHRLRASGSLRHQCLGNRQMNVTLCSDKGQNKLQHVDASSF